MQLRSVLAIAIGISALTAVTAHAAEKSVLAGSTGLAINSSPRIDLVTSVPIDYFNRAVASGRRVISLRVAQPLLCADFAPTPGAAVNPVAISYLDPNGDSSGLLFAGISSFDYYGNGAAASLFKVTADAQLACCIMQPALNAACFQGTAGGASGDGLFSSGFENLVAAAPNSVTIDPVDLAVSVTGPATATPNGNLDYTIEVSNLGANAVSNVVVRDWYPKASGGFPAPLSAGSWTCTPTGTASCGSANGSGNVGLLAVSLNAGAKVTIAVSRTVAGTAPNGTTFSVSAAAFAPPAAAETALANNQGALTATVSPTSFSISDVTQAEGNSGSTNFQFTVTRSNTAGAASVQVSTADVNAAAGSDYTAIAGQTVNFTAGGSATAVVNVAVSGDSVLESNETFAVNLSNPSGGSIGDGQGIGTITNDDSAAIAINDVALSEGDSGNSNASFTITLTNAVQGGFSVPVSSSNGTASAGSDY
ncbi:MAG TPA: Calx-beta domain-containing protein, partial [Xanthomonadales bacterium]|nr:Calx-beta domain-containing protein [Xanthomonadales bacterium]